MCGLAEQRRAHVRSSRQYQCVHPIDERGRCMVALQRRGNDWYEACVLQRREVSGPQSRRMDVGIAPDRGANSYYWAE